MRSIALAAAMGTCALLGASPIAAPDGRVTGQTLATLTLDELEEWGAAVTSHAPGLADPAAEAIARWPPGKLYVLFSELRTLQAFRSNPRVSKEAADKQNYPKPWMVPSLISTALGLTMEERGSGNVNRLLHRAALLHTDIAMLVPGVARASSLSPFSGRITIETQDGRQTGLSGASAHLEFASWLLDGVRPDPSADETVRAWYQAAAAVLQRNLRTGDVDWMLERARAIFPSDALILFYCGALHEMLATPQLQMAMQSARTTTSFKVNTSSEQQELERAAGFLSRALEIDPAFAEARLHRGRVSGLLGRHQPAVADLTQAAAAFTDKTLQYYAALFLGREQDLLGDRHAALESFKQAARLFPRAQSPLLAESELARRAGDSAGALAALERLLALPGSDMARDDPWWWYNASHVEDADARLATWRALFGRGTPR